MIGTWKDKLVNKLVKHVPTQLEKNTKFHQELQRNLVIAQIFQHTSVNQWFTHQLYACYITVLYAA